MVSFVVGTIKEEFLAELVFDTECESWLGFQEALYEGQRNKDRK